MAEVYNCNGTYSSIRCDKSSEELDLPAVSKSGSSKIPEITEVTPLPIVTLTRLRLVSEPVWTFQSAGASFEFGGGSLQIRNVGKVKADQIAVSVFVPGYKESGFKLDGPSDLEVGMTGDYKLLAKDCKDTYIKQGVKLTPRIKCSNCRH